MVLCKQFPRNVTILSDGSVTTCCVDKFGKNTFASVYDKPMLDIWENEIKDKIKEGPDKLKICKSCFHRRPRNKTSDNRFEDYEYPDFLQVEIMAACNYGCCIAKDLHKFRETKPDLNLIFKNIKSFLPKIRQLELFNDGEPLLHDGFCDFVSKCRKESPNLYLNLFTNGFLMGEKMSKFLIGQQVNCVVVSVHGAPGTENMLKYAKYGADYDKVLDNVGTLLKLKTKMNSSLPIVQLKAILFDFNETDELMDQFRKDAQTLGLKATGGEGDCYYWVQDHYKGGPTRHVKGSKALKKLMDSGEFPRWQKPTKQNKE